MKRETRDNLLLLASPLLLGAVIAVLWGGLPKLFTFDFVAGMVGIYGAIIAVVVVLMSVGFIFLGIKAIVLKLVIKKPFSHWLDDYWTPK
jgi:hypothetical protein